MRLGEIAKRLGCEVEGDAQVEIRGVAGIEEAQPGELTFLVNRKYRPDAGDDARFGHHRFEG